MVYRSLYITMLGISILLAHSPVCASGQYVDYPDNTHHSFMLSSQTGAALGLGSLAMVLYVVGGAHFVEAQSWRNSELESKSPVYQQCAARNKKHYAKTAGTCMTIASACMYYSIKLIASSQNT